MAVWLSAGKPAPREASPTSDCMTAICRSCLFSPGTWQSSATPLTAQALTTQMLYSVVLHSMMSMQLWTGIRRALQIWRSGRTTSQKVGQSGSVC